MVANAMTDGPRPKRSRKPKAVEIPVQVRSEQLDPTTRERLTEAGFLAPHEAMVNVERIEQDGMLHEVLTFESGKRLITVNNLQPKWMASGPFRQASE